MHFLQLSTRRTAGRTLSRKHIRSLAETLTVDEGGVYKGVDGALSDAAAAELFVNERPTATRPSDVRYYNHGSDDAFCACLVLLMIGFTVLLCRQRASNFGNREALL